jgi:hypothetical protein
MATLEDIYLFAKGILATGPDINAADAASIDAFLLQLKGGTANCQRLLICMGIDLKNFSHSKIRKNNFPDKAFIKMLQEVISKAAGIPRNKSMPPGEYTHAMRFARALNVVTAVHPPAAIPLDTPAKYFRISPFINYMRYVVAKNLRNNPSLPASLDMEDEELVEEYFEEFTQNERYNRINVSNLGINKSWIFVADKAELQTIRSHIDKDLYQLADTLGFDVNPAMIGQHYICLEYPECFSEPVYQPCTLMADWGSRQNCPKGNDFFLSYTVGEKWGRTWSVSGNQTCMNERTHARFDHGESKTYEFSAAYLGRLTSTIPRGSDAQIIQEALKRFDKA